MARGREFGRYTSGGEAARKWRRRRIPLSRVKEAASDGDAVAGNIGNDNFMKSSTVTRNPKKKAWRAPAEEGSCTAQA